MGSYKDLFIRMSEEHYLTIPEHVREAHLRDKIYSESINDFDELMADENYAFYYKNYKAAKNTLEEHAFNLREKRRNENKLNK